MNIVDFPTTTSCHHPATAIGRFTLSTCPETGEAEWSADGSPVDPAEAMAELFGRFDLVGSFDGLGTPGPSVFVYRPDDRRGRKALDSLPPEGWIEAAPELWITRDDHHLLMCPSDPLMAANLRRRL